MLIISLCCCSKPTAAKKFADTDFESGITLTISGKSYNGSLTKRGDYIEMEVSSGNLTSPLVFSIADGGFCFSSGEQKYSISNENAPAASAIAEIKNAFDSLPLGDIESKDGEMLVKAPFGKLRKNEKTGEFISLSTQNCEVVFTDFEITAKS